MRGGGRSLNGIRYPSRRTDITQGSAPKADHCCQWCDRHPLLAQKGRQSQLERFPDPLPLPPELPEQPVDWEKGRRWLRFLFGLLAT